MATLLLAGRLTLLPGRTQVVPLEVMLADRDFVNYVRHQNMVQAAEQTEALNTIMKYVEDEGLLPLDQADVRRRCLREWNLPETGDIDREVSATHPTSFLSLSVFPYDTLSNLAVCAP